MSVLSVVIPMSGVCVGVGRRLNKDSSAGTVVETDVVEDRKVNVDVCASYKTTLFPKSRTITRSEIGQVLIYLAS